MGKKKSTNNLGKSLIRDRFSGKGRRHPDSHLHTSELDDGYDWNKINLRSVTEESSLEEFLATAEMAGTDFTAEKLNIKFVTQDAKAGLLSPDEKLKMQEAQDAHRQLLSVPRRPFWDKTTTAAELDEKERESFLEWRRKLSHLSEVEGLVLTPFERNLDFWRQLWRVVERSDVIVQIVDARNPLLYRSEDLECYVHEVDLAKLNMILINKADYLTQNQREMWTEYFDAAGVQVAFWSAVMEEERLKAEAKAEMAELEVDGSDFVNELAPSAPCKCEESNCAKCKDQRLNNIPTAESEVISDTEKLNIASDSSTSDELCETRSSDGDKPDSEWKSMENCDSTCSVGDSSSRKVKNDPTVLMGPELIELFKKLHTGKKVTEGITTIGMVGYPNVGKSSTINALLRTKKVPVSATPGRTKHFQTLYLEKTLLVCDCPGLVMPTFLSTKADMVLSGILPIDQMRDYVGPVATLCTLIPRLTLEHTYGIMIPKPIEGEDENRPPTAHELLSAYGFMRGYMTHKGIPDYPRSARQILKDFVNGKLMYSHAPPGSDEEMFCPSPVVKKTLKERSHLQQLPIGSRKVAKVKYANQVDQAFFESPGSGMGYKGKNIPPSASQDITSSKTQLAEKPWKKHGNHNRKEKLRRIHSHLDA